jgi:beta-1,4-galactosyltransferase 1
MKIYENIILIPFRKREEHLDYFIKNTVPLFETYLPNSKVVVIEQEEGKLFNRGMLLNIGFNEYKDKTKYFFTHDVDMNPTEEIVKYIYTENNEVIYRIKSAHNHSLGGIIKLKHNTIFDINGFPNHIWGWGIEDRALYFRCRIKNISITNNKLNNFKILNHTSNAEVYTGEKKVISDIWREQNINKLNTEQRNELIMSSGLNNLQYTIKEHKIIHEIVELITVGI